MIFNTDVRIFRTPAKLSLPLIRKVSLKMLTLQSKRSYLKMT
nr:MAG TPA: hypothetical protein [Bacteriophage sp.]